MTAFADVVQVGQTVVKNVYAVYFGIVNITISLLNDVTDIDLQRSLKLLELSSAPIPCKMQCISHDRMSCVATICLLATLFVTSNKSLVQKSIVVSDRGCLCKVTVIINDYGGVKSKDCKDTHKKYESKASHGEIKLSCVGVVAWHSGRMLVFDRRTFRVLHWTSS